MKEAIDCAMLRAYEIYIDRIQTYYRSISVQTEQMLISLQRCREMQTDVRRCLSQVIFGLADVDPEKNACDETSQQMQKIRIAIPTM